MFVKRSYAEIVSIETYMNECSRDLFNPEKVRKFTYPTDINSIDEGVWDVSLVKEINNIASNQLILKEISKRNGVYALFIRKPKRKWKFKYIGETKSVYARQRIRNHTMIRNEQTGSKLEMVKKSLREGYEIGVSFVEIEPGYLRLAVEEYLIRKKNPEWNIHSVDT